MKRSITSYHVGGALYIPSTQKNLKNIILNAYYPYLKSVIIDFEDAIYEDDFETSSKHFEKLLSQIPAQELLIFVRPRNSKHLKALLTLPQIEKIDGFVLAKFDTTTMEDYYSYIPKENFWVMPVLESIEVFSKDRLEEIRDFLFKNRETILMLRFGGEDLSSYLGLKRNCENTLYDLPSLLHLLNSIVLMFKPLGFAISAPVYACYQNPIGFEKELEKDILTGLFGKTLIHPRQALLCNELYKVESSEFEAAQKILDKKAKAIFAYDGMMMETLPHRRWAEGIIERAGVYGVK